MLDRNKQQYDWHNEELADTKGLVEDNMPDYQDPENYPSIELVSDPDGTSLIQEQPNLTEHKREIAAAVNTNLTVPGSSDN